MKKAYTDAQAAEEEMNPEKAVARMQAQQAAQEE